MIRSRFRFEWHSRDVCQKWWQDAWFDYELSKKRSFLVDTYALQHLKCQTLNFYATKMIKATNVMHLLWADHLIFGNKVNVITKIQSFKQHLQRQQQKLVAIIKFKTNQNDTNQNISHIWLVLDWKLCHIAVSISYLLLLQY